MSENMPDLTAGSILELESTADDALENLHAEIIGCSRDNGITLTHPASNGIPIQIHCGDRFFASTRQGNTDITFETEVVAVLSNPSPQLQTTYPEDIRSGSLRKSNRISPAPANLRLAGSNINSEETISLLNISCSGACLIGHKQLGGVNNLFQIEIQTGGEQSYIPIDCMVRHVREISEKNQKMFHHGVIFIGMDAETQLFLWKFVQRSTAI